MWHIHGPENILAMKRSGVLIQPITWVNLKILCQVEEATHKEAQLYDLFHVNIQKMQIQRHKEISGCLIKLTTSNFN